MSIRRRKKRVALLIGQSRRPSASGTRTVKTASNPTSVKSVAQVGRTSSAGAAAKRHSMEWEEEHITTDLLQDALAGTASALEANRRKPQAALPGLGTSVRPSTPRRSAGSLTGSVRSERRSSELPGL